MDNMTQITTEVFLEKFASIFDDTDASLLTPSTEFKTLDEWSSLVALSLIAMADEEFDVKISGDDIRSSTTIEDILNKVNNKLA